MHSRPFLAVLAALAGVAASACSCAKEPELGERLDLLARRPDAIVELPGAIVSRGDVPGMATWGASEGPGWAQADLRLPDGTHYRESNQARAALVLPATRPCEREIVLALWCARPAGAEPARVRVRLNEVELAEDGLPLGREPALVRVHAPAEAWVRGENLLELVVPAVERDGGRAWDTLALASVSYGAEARVTIDTARGTARLVDGTGLRYALELASGAMLELRASASRRGTLLFRTGTLDPHSGVVELEDGGSLSVTIDDGESTLTRALPLRPARARVVELEWSAPEGGELVLHSLAVREHASPPRPPIVFVSIDTFAAEHLSLYGYERATSPQLERLARDAVVFERCLTNAPWTLPSYLSVMSGLYPRAHWLDLEGSEPTPFDRWQLADSRWTLAEALRARGYRTGGFVDTQWLTPIFRFQQGFDVYDGQCAVAPFEDPAAHIRRIVEELAPAWLDAGRAGSPPFLFVHALDAHGPYLPDEPFRDAFSRALPEPRRLVAAGSNNETYRTMPEWMGLTFAPEEERVVPPQLPIEDTIARYDESLLKVDHYLGLLFDGLRARGLYDEAVIVVTGDHGERFGPDAFGHGVMSQDVLHVPLVLKLPSNAHGGVRVKEGVQLVDLYPTLLELAGADMRGRDLHGSSLLAAVERAGAPHERALFSEGGHVEQYALTEGCWRLVEERPGSESSESSLLTHPRVSDDWYRTNAPELLTRPLTAGLLAELKARAGFADRMTELRRRIAGPYYALYDLCRDPEEREDRAATEPERVARMKSALEAEKQRARAAQAQADPLRARPALPPDALRRLQELGYGGAAEDEPEGTTPGSN